MRVFYALVGYDKHTEAMSLRRDIPSFNAPTAKAIAGIRVEDDTQVGDWELDPSQARDIAGLIRVDLPPHAMDFFLEPYTCD